MLLRSPWLFLACVGAGCAAPRSVERVPMCPPLSIEVPTADPSREPAVRAAADVSPPERAAAEWTPSPMRETAPTYRTVVHVVEVPVEAPVRVQAWADTQPQSSPYDPSYDAWVDAYRYQDSRRRWREPFFPINTALGAGVGAIIGHQSHRRGRGALIGGGLGLLLDLDRWFR